jgi:hypothetical protein
LNLCRHISRPNIGAPVHRPRPGVGPAARGLTVHRFRSRNKNPNQVFMCFSVGSVFGHLMAVNAHGRSGVRT